MLHALVLNAETGHSQFPLFPSFQPSTCGHINSYLLSQTTLIKGHLGLWAPCAQTLHQILSSLEGLTHGVEFHRQSEKLPSNLPVSQQGFLTAWNTKCSQPSIANSTSNTLPKWLGLASTLRCVKRT